VNRRFKVKKKKENGKKTALFPRQSKRAEREKEKKGEVIFVQAL
jgi:hypothetical protein